MRLLFLCRFSLCLLLYINIPLVCTALQRGAATAPQTLSTDAADTQNIAFAFCISRHYFDVVNSSAQSPSAGVNNVINLEPDSIGISATTLECGKVQGTVRFISRKGSTPVGLLNISLDNNQSSNYILVPSTTAEGSSTVDFTLTVDDPSIDAHAVVIVMDRTLQVVTRSYHYTAEKITVAPTAVAFGTLAIGVEKCREVKFTNPTTKPLEVRSIELVDGAGEFTLTSLPAFPLVLPPGQSVSINACGKATSEGEYKNSIRVQLSCYSRAVVALSMHTFRVRVTMDDRNFDEVLVNTEQSQQVIIENISNGEVPVELYSVDWDDKVHFRTEGLEDDKFPIVLSKPGDTYTFTVYYKPTEEGVQNSTVARFTGNTTFDKTTSIWSGRGMLPVSVHEQQPLQFLFSSIVPQPLVGAGKVSYNLDSPVAVVLSVYTILGERVLLADEGIQSAGEHTIPIDAAHLLPGLYLFRLDAGGRSAVRTVLVRE